MSTVDTIRSVAAHRGMSCLELHQKLGEQAREIRVLRSRAQLVTVAEARVDKQAHTIHANGLQIGDLRMRLEDATQKRDAANAKAVRCDEAEARAHAAEQRMADMRAELLALRAFKANVTSVSAPAVGERDDHDPEDRATRPLPVIAMPLSQPPMATTDPGRLRTTWGRDADDTKPLPKATPAA